MPGNVVRTGKLEDLRARLHRLGVRQSDLVETFVLGSGHGGQKVNKTNSCVCLRHGPSGMVIKCQAARSRELNRFLARRELCERLEEKAMGEASARRQAAERIRRQKRRRSRRQKERMLQAKHHRAGIKAMRGPPGSDD
jgi:protein subunit release factor B